MMTNSISISFEEWAGLNDAARLLDCLYAKGVYSWEGYAQALAMYEAEDDEE